ncbi:hypothetical protein BJF93_11955 [Xaviernesmea oryzae]|uniref:Gfo/Idh/MocA family oxidoreductase n=1 Tax=Xaviernesmea oryzae TaxID=464029 RepID=A0A1Q9AVE6_9HYPH|nr:Gfo/Idh/MocA family oxidoreductase [Xaviernesmea oryzae]OLP59425.1 hypothetical protein BJF93_11955 [Xaviernesmea oryzae]
MDLVRTSPVPLRWGVIGAGEIGITFAQDIASVPNARLTAVTSRRPDRARLYAERFGGLACLPDLDALLAHDVDAIYIATPNTQHAEQAVRALAAGKHVLVEKPLAMSAEEGRAIQAAAKAHGGFAMEALWTVFLPAITQLRNLLQEGAIGEIRQVSAQLAYQKPEDPRSRFFSAELGGGAMLDLGIYLVGLTLHLFGSPKDMSGRWQAASTGVDMRADMRLAYEGFSAELACGFDRTETNRYVIAGETGALIIDQPFIAAPRLYLSRSGMVTRQLGASGHALAGKLLQRLTAWPLVPGVRQFPHPGSGLGFEIEAASRAIYAGKTQLSAMPLARSIEALAILDRIRAQPPENSRQSG